MKTYETTSEAYLALLHEVLYTPDHESSPRGLPCRELIDHQFRVARPSRHALRTHDPDRDRRMARYLEIERALYLQGELSAERWAREASSFWAQLANPDGTINSNYGFLALQDRSLPEGRTPYEWARHCLVDDRDTRQAFVRVSQPRHQWAGNRDQVCTMHVNFRLRLTALHATCVMRSCDIVKGLAYDMPWWCDVLGMLARDVGAEVGTYTHYCHSLHLYERDVPTARRMLGDEL